jgi:hypothetical protein
MGERQKVLEAARRPPTTPNRGTPIGRHRTGTLRFGAQRLTRPRRPHTRGRQGGCRTHYDR